mmetsp:Transcript_6801/g.10795  ORF Transcript_6801/g.10795 Transcript_6801/m.10795 type:complete len:121 (+) Transcript_6801:474-836(+)
MAFEIDSTVSSRLGHGGPQLLSCPIIAHQYKKKVLLKIIKKILFTIISLKNGDHNFFHSLTAAKIKATHQLSISIQDDDVAFFFCGGSSEEEHNQQVFFSLLLLDFVRALRFFSPMDRKE